MPSLASGIAGASHLFLIPLGPNPVEFVGLLLSVDSISQIMSKILLVLLLFLYLSVLLAQVVWPVRSLIFVEACGIQFPDQESNPGPLHLKCGLSHWTTREVPRLYLRNYCSFFRCDNVVVIKDLSFRVTYQNICR